MRTKKAILIVLMGIISPCIAHACSIVYPTVRVGTKFRVRVMNDHRPIGSLQLVLGDPGAVALHTFTGADGYASFSNLHPGSFLLTADHDGGVADGVVVEVSANGPTDVTIPLKWPNSVPVNVRSVSGAVRGPEYYPSQAQVQLSLSLLEGVSARVLATVLADSKGRFNFTDKVPPGIYFLRLNSSGLRGWSGEEMQGMIAINVTQDANDGLDLDLGWSSCGLRYAEREIHPPAALRRLCGDVSDSEGAVVSDAEVLLLETSEKARVVGQTRTRVTGQFAFQAHLSGDYQLLIRSGGFQPFLQPIRIEGTGPAEGCNQPFHARLQLMQ
jgi:Carboxypeptidase regulatory-like domain